MSENKNGGNFQYKKPFGLKNLQMISILLFFMGGFFVLGVGKASAATYYVDATNGNDSYDGIADIYDGSHGPWQTVAKVNSSSFSAGDSILFKRGEIWNEVLTTPRSGIAGNKMIWSAYGTGNNPQLKGFVSNSKSYQLIDGLTLINSGAGSKAISLYQAPNVTIQNSILGATSYGISVGKESASLTLTDVTQIGSMDSYFLIISGISNSNLTINGLVATTGSQGIYLSQINGGSLNNIVLDNINPNSALQLTGNTGIWTLENYTASNISQASKDGIFLNANLWTSLTITNATVDTTGGAGIRITNNDNVSVYDSTFTRAGVYIDGTSSNLYFEKVTVEDYGGDGFSTTDSAHDIVYKYCISRRNGNISGSSSGDGFTAHSTNYNIKILYSLAYDNLNDGVALVGTSSGEIYNSVFWNNGGDYTGEGGVDMDRGSVYFNLSDVNPITGDTWVMRDNIIGQGYPREVTLNAGATSADSIVDFDYNSYWPVAYSQFAQVISGSTNISWDAYHATRETYSNVVDPLFINSEVDFHLSSDSPAIDSGTNVGLTTDYVGNPIYGLPDIGAYEYQPTHEMNTDNPQIGETIRIYGDGKFRNTVDDSNSNETTTANLSIIPQDSNTTNWIDLNISTWQTNNSCKKTWTENGDNLGKEDYTLHTVGDLVAGRSYNVKIDDTLATDNITGTNCQNGICTADTNGEITFTYTGGYSTHTFDIEDTDPSYTGVATEPSEDEEEDDNQRNLNLHKVKATSTTNSITINWKTDYATKDTIYYGTNKNLKNKQKDHQKEKKHTLTLRDLLPNTTYYFKIKSTDGLDNKDTSRIHKIRTQAVSTPVSTNVSTSSNPSPSTCSYTVQQGDTLWNISQKVYGNGLQYQKIIDLNKAKYPSIAFLLNVGQELSFGCE